MRKDNPIWNDTLPIALGQLLGIAAVCAVFALLGRFDGKVLLGSVAGSVLAIGNYFLMYLFAARAAEKASNQDVAGGQKLIQLSYMGRMAGLLVGLVLFAKSGWCNPIALVIPLALNRPILTVHELLRRKGGVTE